MAFFSIFKETEPNKGKRQQPPPPNSTFDRLPNEVIHIILNKVQDAKTLIRCLSLNKRFFSIIPQTDTVSLSLVLPNPQKDDDDNNHHNNVNYDNNITDSNSVNIVKSTVNYLITKLLRRNSDTFTDPLYRRLRTFRCIKHLHLEIHTDPVEVTDDFLKWKATYGSEFRTCSILCALSFRWLSNDYDDGEPSRRYKTPPSPYLVNYELRWRKQWMAKCMTAASARHSFVKQMLPWFPALETVTISDSRRQGRFFMAEEEIRDLRESMKRQGTAETSPQPPTPEQREEPKFLMRMWYATELDLPAMGCAWNEAMRLEIVPVEGDNETVASLPENEGGGFDCDEEEKAMLAEAQREIVNPSKTVSYSWVLL